MNHKERMERTKHVLEYLNHEQRRCTYGALAGILGVKPRGVAQYLGDRRKETSWVVRADRGKPRGFAVDQMAEGFSGSPEPIDCSHELRRLVDGFHEQRRMRLMLWLRRLAMVCSHVDAANALVDSMTDLCALIPQIGKTRTGRPRAPDLVAEWFGKLPMSNQAAVIGKIATINVNMGYAWEGAFKLLLDIEGIEYQTGSDGHNLPQLYKKLPDQTKQSICDLYRQVDLTDLEFLECFSDTARSQGFPRKKSPGHPTFGSDLEYYHQQEYFQRSRYKYVNVTTAKPILCLLPLRFLKLIKEAIDHVITPKLSLTRKNEPSSTTNSMLTNRDEPKVAWNGKEFKLALPINGNLLEAQITPRFVYIVQTRESGTTDWGPGFETPFSNFRFVKLKPDTEYEYKVTPKEDGQEREPSYEKARKVS